MELKQIIAREIIGDLSIQNTPGLISTLREIVNILEGENNA